MLINIVALGAYAAFLIVAFGSPSPPLGAVERIRGGTPAPGTYLWCTALAVLGATMTIAAPVLAVIDPDQASGGTLQMAAWGVVLLAVAIGLAQAASIAIAAPATTRHADGAPGPELVTRGIFAVTRNPVILGWILASVGVALLIPSSAAFAGAANLVIAAEVLVRRVEEPKLIDSHGDAYREYAGRTGRFLPGIGRRRL